MLTFQEQNSSESVDHFQAMDPYLVGLVNQLKDQYKQVESPKDFEADPQLYNYA